METFKYGDMTSEEIKQINQAVAKLSDKKIQRLLINAKKLSYYRCNPVIACRDLLGIELLDYQSWKLEMSWNTANILWCESRNAGKSFMIAVFCMLKALLYENQYIYIVSNVGEQSKETFDKIEQIATCSGSVSVTNKNLQKVFDSEVYKTPACKSGFSHPQTGYKVTVLTGSKIKTLNGNPDSNRGKRATLVVYDEAGFCTPEIFASSTAFVAQNADFCTSTDEEFDVSLETIKIPQQTLYASSASDESHVFFKKYKLFAMKMIIGDENYFCCDLNCELPLHPLKDSEPHVPLLSQTLVDSEMKTNKFKALREFYNKFDNDGDDSQIIKKSTIVRNSTFYLPQLCNESGKDKFIIALDPARTLDNSSYGVLKVNFDERLGYYGDVVNIQTFKDLISSSKNGSLRSTQQVEKFREVLLDYNGNAEDYDNLERILVDDGAGGAGVARWNDDLVENWNSLDGTQHYGLIDLEHKDSKIWKSQFPEAIPKLSLVTFKSVRTQMIENLVKMMDLGLIKFPKEFDGRDFVSIPDGTSTEDEDSNLVYLFKKQSLSLEERNALIQIDALKSEMRMFHRFKTTQGGYNYNIPSSYTDAHDDRFMVMCMLAWELMKIREEYRKSKRAKPKKKRNWSNISCIG